MSIVVEPAFTEELPAANGCEIMRNRERSTLSVCEITCCHCKGTAWCDAVRLGSRQSAVGERCYENDQGQPDDGEYDVDGQWRARFRSQFLIVRRRAVTLPRYNGSAAGVEVGQRR